MGHEAMETTLTYLHAHLELKESALAKLKPYERHIRLLRHQSKNRQFDMACGLATSLTLNGKRCVEIRATVLQHAISLDNSQ